MTNNDKKAEGAFKVIEVGEWAWCDTDYVRQLKIENARLTTLLDDSERKAAREYMRAESLQKDGEEKIARLNKIIEAISPTEDWHGKAEGAFFPSLRRAIEELGATSVEGVIVLQILDAGDKILNELKK